MNRGFFVFAVIASTLWAASPALCLDPISIVVAPVENKSMIDKFKTQKLSEIAQRLLAKKLNQTGVFEVQERSAGKAAPGQKAKPASLLILTTLSAGPPFFGKDKRDIITVDARVCKVSNNETLGAFNGHEACDTALTLPEKDEDWGEAQFLKTPAGVTLDKALDQIAGKMAASGDKPDAPLLKF